jgi:hypothetical protein
VRRISGLGSAAPTLLNYVIGALVGDFDNVSRVARDKVLRHDIT